MNKKQYKQVQAGLLIATIIVWIIFGCLYLEGTWKEELEEHNNMTKLRYGDIDFDFENISYPYFNKSIEDGNANNTRTP